ncbi:hypothetical protein PsorP6_014247 [Peronosclerospora sorghi]|uniref:Uncharacterized protein n=1 Tax=Peronosclerospora sorghi TaxID=230839 RepID=A0ACC0VHU4_9STRA|nr:hypothetical protein PsorP6_014247 [Peronosclerospora sorghi]
MSKLSSLTDMIELRGKVGSGHWCFRRHWCRGTGVGARRLEALETVKTKIEQQLGDDGNILIIKTDDVQNLVQAAETTFGTVDTLVNNAGVMPFELLSNMNQDSWDRTIEINCKGTLNGVAAVLPQMKARKTGHIVNILVPCFFVNLRLARLDMNPSFCISMQPGNVATDLVKHAGAAPMAWMRKP